MAPNEFDSGDRRWRFGTYLLDPAKRLLLKDGRPLSLTPRSLDVLCYLVEHHERVVLKDELLAALWGNVVVEEGSALEGARRLAATIARRGPLSNRLAKELVDAAQDMPIDAAMSMSTVSQQRIFESSDLHEGVSAFFAKREPDFSAR